MSVSKVFCAALALFAAVSVRVSAAQEFSFHQANPPATSFMAAVSAAELYSTSAPEPDAAAPNAAIVAVPQPLPVKKTSTDGGRILPFSRLAIGTRAGTLGLGAQIATPLTRRLNLRGGVDLLNYHYAMVNDGTNYNGELNLKSGTVSLDAYPFRKSSFHISPGILIFKSHASAGMNVPGGNSFSMGNDDYTSDPNDPIAGTGSIAFSRSIMPMLTFGFGNMIKRESNKHWSVPFEIGAAYTGHYTAAINLTGSACDADGCGPTNDPSVQSSVTQQQNDINETTKHLQFYPILTTGLAYRF